MVTLTVVPSRDYLTADDLVDWSRRNMQPMELSADPRERLESLYAILETACMELRGDHTNPKTPFAAVCHHLAGYIAALEDEALASQPTGNHLHA